MFDWLVRLFQKSDFCRTPPPSSEPRDFYFYYRTKRLPRNQKREELLFYHILSQRWACLSKKHSRQTILLELSYNEIKSDRAIDPSHDGRKITTVRRRSRPTSSSRCRNPSIRGDDRFVSFHQTTHLFEYHRLQRRVDQLNNGGHVRSSKTASVRVCSHLPAGRICALCSRAATAAEVRNAQPRRDFHEQQQQQQHLLLLQQRQQQLSELDDDLAPSIRHFQWRWGCANVSCHACVELRSFAANTRRPDQPHRP